MRNRFRTRSMKVVRMLKRQREAAGAEAAEAAAADGGEETPCPAGEAGDETPGADLAELEAELEAAMCGEAEAVEEDEAPPWPQAGVKVAVGVEHLSHSLRVGETGISEGLVPGDSSEVVVKMDYAMMLATVRIPRSLLVPVGRPMRNMRMWDKCSEAVKREILLQIGVRDPRDEVLPSTPGFTLTMWGEYVPIGLRFQEEPFGAPALKFVQPAFVKELMDGHELLAKVEAGAAAGSVAEVQGQTHRQHGRQRLLKDWWTENEVLLLCLYDEASNSSALLAVRRNPLSVRFYQVRSQ